MQLHCPQCHADSKVEVGPDQSVTCPSCGFSISTADSAMIARIAGWEGAPTVSFDEAQVGAVAPPAAVGVNDDGRTADPLPSIAAPAPATQWLGRYRIVRYISSGSFGDVYQAFDSKLQRAVAIKVPRREKFRSDTRFQQFLRSFSEEGRRAAQLIHPGIVRVYDVEYDDASSSSYIVMEYVDGQSLDHRLRNDPPSVVQVVDWIAQVAEAMHVAHKQGFVHRDLKPSNILIDSTGRARVVDFGLALHETEQHRHSGEVAGTWAYMSPEQVRGRSEHLDGRTDIWSLGAILYRALVGRVPFNGNEQQLRDQILNREPKPFSQLNDSLPRELEQICLKGCLVKSVADRLPSARDLCEALRRWLDENRSTNRQSAGPAAEPAPGSAPGSAPPGSLRTDGPATDRASSTGAPVSTVHEPAPAARRGRRWWLGGALALAIAGLGLMAAYLPGGPWKQPPHYGDRFYRVRNVDHLATPNRALNLLERDPIEVIWPTSEPHSWSRNSTEQTLAIPSFSPSLLGLGWTTAENYRLSIEFRKTSWDGFSGIFLGMTPDDARDEADVGLTSRAVITAGGSWTYAAIGLEKPEDNQPVSVGGFEMRHQLTAEGFEGSSKLHRRAQLVELSDQPQRLTIEVRNGQIDEVYFNSVRLSEVAKSISSGGAGGSCRGFFGIMNYYGSVVIHRAEFTLLK